MASTPKAVRVDGTAGADLMVGRPDAPNITYAGNGNDTIIGGALNDLLVGEAGRDVIDVGDLRRYGVCGW